MWQNEFVAALRDPTRPPAITDDARRFAVYRNNVYVSLVDALVAGFPKTHELVGDAFFRAMARGYAAERLPKTPILAFYGDDFGSFIRGFQPAEGVPYLGDIADLKFARRQALHAPETAPLETTTVDPVTAIHLPRMGLRLHPSLTVLSSSYPQYDIWRRLTDTPGHPLSESGQDVVVGRRAEEVTVTKLPVGGAAFLSALGAGKPVSAATEAAWIRNAEDLQNLIVLGLHWAVALTTPESACDVAD